MKEVLALVLVLVQVHVQKPAKKASKDANVEMEPGTSIISAKRSTVPIPSCPTILRHVGLVWDLVWLI